MRLLARVLESKEVVRKKVFEARNQSYYNPNPVCCSLILHICTIVGVVKINQIWMKHLALVFDGVIGM